MADEKLTNKQAVEEAKRQLKEEGVRATKKSVEERTKLIKKIQDKKGSKTGDEKVILNREMKLRAKENSVLPRDLNRLQPSQMTLEEMKEYCDENKIEIKEGDSTIIIRMRIKAFRNPNRAERLKMLEDRQVVGKIIR